MKLLINKDSIEQIIVFTKEKPHDGKIKFTNGCITELSFNGYDFCLDGFAVFEDAVIKEESRTHKLNGDDLFKKYNDYCKFIKMPTALGIANAQNMNGILKVPRMKFIKNLFTKKPKKDFL